MAKKDRETQTVTSSDVGSVEAAGLVKQETGALAAYDYGEDAVAVGAGPGKGYEHQTSADTAIPFLVVLQPMSPVVVEQKVEGARAGMIMNTVTQRLWENPAGLHIVPATTRHAYVEFVPRDQGGGFRGQHEIDSPIVLEAIARNKKDKLEFGEYYTPDNNELIETFYVYCALSDEFEDALGMAIFAFTSSKIKVYKNWISTVRAHTVLDPNGNKVIPPLFCHLVKVTTEMKKNDKGVFAVPIMSPAKRTLDASMLPKTDSRFLMARACKELVDSGQAKVDFDKSREGGDQGGKTEGNLF